VTVVDVSVGVDKSSASIGFAVEPPALVHRSVWPNLSTLALSGVRVHPPLSFVFRSVLQNDLLSVLEVFARPVVLVEHVSAVSSVVEVA
jgi:hypothetical protein